ncbi:hypothetical protein DCCM_0916 [Desulfocucumis palustris]|uniref:Uncharacterized protein n=1 Tax=Desulfocucumis palustris TaxID=1898651 RepID=A0A2L2X9K1_9FIRM|nr:hypothetical protein DCCM_0916 [Desulfocucumis palustris]
MIISQAKNENKEDRLKITGPLAILLPEMISIFTAFHRRHAGLKFWNGLPGDALS